MSELRLIRLDVYAAAVTAAGAALIWVGHHINH